MEPSSLPQDIVDRVVRDFSESDRSEVISILSVLDLPLSSVTNNQRVMRCVLVAANGSREKFNNLINEAQRDWRDVIMAGEYGLVSGKLVRLLDLTDSFLVQEG